MQIRGDRAATACGLLAIVMWSIAPGLIRSISETLGPLGGAAMIFSLGSLVLLGFLGRPRLHSTSTFYLIAGSALFVANEACFSPALGFASNRMQAIELGVVNYLWPCLTVLLAIIMNGQKTRWIIVPGTLLSLFGIVWVVSGDGASLTRLVSNVESNPLSYSLALACAITFAFYCNVTRKYGGGQNLIVLFFILTAAVLWLKYAFSSEVIPAFTEGSCLELIAACIVMASGYALWNIGILRGNITLLATSSYATPPSCHRHSGLCGWESI